jgi:tetratricopeptide (TPR) repeat protein
MLKLAAPRQSSAGRVWRDIALLLFAVSVIVVGIERQGLGAQRQFAMGFDANVVKPHLVLGNVWFDQHKQDDAVAGYREAIHLDSDNTNAHLSQGIVWRIRGKQDDAAAEYREAIHLDPQLAIAYYSLGLALHRLANSSPDAPDRARRLRDACGAFMQGASLAPIDPDFHARMRDINMLLHGAGHCPSE